MRALLPDEQSLACDSIAWETKRVIIEVSGARSTAACPSCGHLSHRVHSRYVRTLADLPWQGWEVQLRWHCRRFFCGNATCEQRIFTERLPEVAAPHARRTCRLGIILRAVAFACGGEEGARLAERLGVPASPDTLLREIRRTPCGPCSPVRVLGVDDWALRRGQRYGTILVDLEQRRAVDLLPERSSEAFALWLEAHPEVEIVSRDRGDYYIKGANAGAPQATQVADRWHLLHNLQEAIVRLVERLGKPLKEAADRMASESQLGPRESAKVEEVSALPTPQVPTQAAREQGERRARRLDRYRQVVDLHQQNVPQREIARRMGLHRSTVRAWLRAGCYPERAGRHCRRRIDDWTDYLEKRWLAGCHNAATLTTELQAQGFGGSYHMVRRYVGKWRQPDAAGGRVTIAKRSSSSHSPRSMAWLIFRGNEEREPQQQRLVQAFCEACPDVDLAVSFVEQFRRLTRERHADELDAWLARATTAEAPCELQRFAEGIQADIAAVKAALSLPWSNGQTEGQVNRLKSIKRQMYGRANFDLLRQRVVGRTG